jgi:hypothetical protein
MHSKVTKTDIFENYATGIIECPTSSVGVAGAGVLNNQCG